MILIVNVLVKTLLTFLDCATLYWNNYHLPNNKECSPVFFVQLKVKLQEIGHQEGSSMSLIINLVYK